RARARPKVNPIWPNTNMQTSSLVSVVASMGRRRAAHGSISLRGRPRAEQPALTRILCYNTPGAVPTAPPTAGVDLGTNQGHAGRLTLCFVIRPDIPKVNPQVVATGSGKLIRKGILATQHIGNVLPRVP